MKRKNKDWKTSEVRYLQQNRFLPDGEIAEALQRSEGAIKGARIRYGIKKDGDGRFKKHSVPWNKGISHNAGGRSPQTRFKPGNLPANTKHDYAISYRYNKETPYKYIRVALGVWVLLHRYVWELTNGEIPAGHNVTFKDGDTTNCDISNLELISKRENMERNRNHKKAAETLKKTWNYQRSLAAFGLYKPLMIRYETTIRSTRKI